MPGSAEKAQKMQAGGPVVSSRLFLLNLSLFGTSRTVKDCRSGPLKRRETNHRKLLLVTHYKRAPLWSRL